MPLTYSNLLGTPAGNALSNKITQTSTPALIQKTQKPTVQNVSIPSNFPNYFSPPKTTAPVKTTPTIVPLTADQMAQSTQPKTQPQVQPQSTSQYTSVNPVTGTFGTSPGPNGGSQDLAVQPQGTSTGTPATAANPGNATGGFAPTPTSQNPTGSLYNPGGTANPTPFSTSFANIPSTFGGYVGALGNQGNSPYNTSAQNSIGLLQQATQGNAALGQNAQDIANVAGNSISKIGQLGATGGGYLDSGANPTLASGLDAQVRQTAALQQQAVAQGANMQLQGNAQALTAQGQQQTGYNEAAGQSLTGQSTAQSALSSAAGLATPQFGAYGQTSYNPLTGASNSGGAGVSPSDPFYQTLQTYANLLATGQGSAIPSSITGNSVLNAQIQQMATQINPSFNNNTAAGQASAQQNNASVAGSAQTNANQTVYSNAVSDLAQTTAAVSAIDSFGTQLIQNMSNPAANGGLGINPSSSQWGNLTLSQLQQQFNSPQYAQFNTNLQGLQARISALLGTGEIPSAATAGATAIVNGNATPAAMQATLNQIANEGAALIQSKAQIASSAYQNIQSNSGGSSGSGSSGTPMFGSFN